MSTDTPEQRELALVGKVELRIALADSDTKLQALLNTYLPPLLLKLASDHEKVRFAVISICQHVNARIKPPSIKLPVSALLKQFKTFPNQLTRHFDLLYIHQGIDRIPVDERVALLPLLLQGFHSNYEESTTLTANLFNLLLKILHSLSLPERGSGEDISLREKFGLIERPEDATFVATWLGKLILFSIPQAGTTRCPGLSVEDCSFLQLQSKPDVWTPNVKGGLNLVETKVAAAKFLASGAFLDAERFLPALFASADPISRLADVGDDILKRATSSVSLEEHALIEKLLETYLGTSGAEGSLPARVPLQAKILALLSKSKLSSSFVPQSIQIVRQGLTPYHNDASVGTPKHGLEASKLRVQVFAFTNWLARISSPEDIRAFASEIIFRLRDYIEFQGWPVFKTEGPRPDPTELKSRGYGYECIGLLAAASPDSVLIEPNLDILRWLLTALSADPSGNDISISIEQALSNILGAFGRGLDSNIEEALTELLLRHMDQFPGETDSKLLIVRSTRFVAVRFANRCLPYRNVMARWMNMLAIAGDANDRSEVKEEGKKGLDPYWFRMFNPPKDILDKDDSKYQFPAFADLVEKFFGPETPWDSLTALGSQVQLANAYNPAISFCRKILLHHGLSSTEKAPGINAEWEKNIDALVLNDEESRGHLKEYLKNLLETHDRSRHAVQLYLIASFRGMTSNIGEDSYRSGESCLELTSLCPDSILDHLRTNIPNLQDSILSNQRSSREVASRLFGILASREQGLNENVQRMVQVFDQKIRDWRQAIGVEVFRTHGALLANSYFLSRLTYRAKASPDEDGLRLKLVTSCLDILSESRDKMLLDAAVTALADLSLFGTILPDEIPLPHTVSDLLQKLRERSKTGDEKSIAALGFFAMQCTESKPEDALDTILKILYGLEEVRQPEVQFAIGSALSCAAAGWHSKALISSLEIQGPLPQTPKRNSTLSRVFDKVLLDCRATKPSLRQASVIWLLCLVQYCGHLDDGQTRLRRCQAAFKSFLSDRESLNQESASRGLTLVYEKGNRSLKDDLIRDLVGSFTGTSTGLVGNVSDETELFEPGALPTGDGSVTTYKDIMSLASEVGDPGLVYRFMSLASNNAIWSSRAAFGRFGLSNILSDSSVDGYLAQNTKLYPALFRYRFDPNPNVRTSMNDIWNALVRDPTAIIDQHFDAIMDDLLKNILGREWRVRQASCAAIADLVQGRPLGKYEKYLTRIWTLTFKVCDDIKDSVRKAAMGLAKVLTGVLTRLLEAADSSSRNANTMLKEVIPFLLSPSGLESSAKEVQLFALVTLLQIIKSSNGKTLRPFIPNLVSHLIALLSSLEPQEVNYIHLNAGQYDLTTQQIDDARLNSVKGSPMMEAIERCLDILDEETLAALCPSLENAIKTAIGLPSKVGSMRALVSLSTRQNFIFKAYADRFLRLILKQVLDRNETVSSSYAVGCGYLSRLATDAEILNLVKFCQRLYFDSEDERHRSISGEIIYAVSKRATDRFNSIASDILPFVFIAKHDSSERVKEYFQDTWNENVGGSRTVLLYLKEIITLAIQHLDSPRWSVKHTSAIAVADVVASSGSEIKDAEATIIWPALEKALGGKSWEGKEKVLTSLVEYVKSSNILILDAGIANQIQTIFLRESKRTNPTYRRFAIACLGDFVQLQPTISFFSAVYAITEPIITGALDAADDDTMDVDSQQAKGLSSKTLNEATLANALATLLKSIPSLPIQSDSSAAPLTSHLSQTLNLVSKSIAHHPSNRTILESIYSAQKSLFERLLTSSSTSTPDEFENILASYIPTLFVPNTSSFSDQIEQTRMKAAEAADSLAVLAVQKKLVRVECDLIEAVKAVRETERSQVVQGVLDRTVKVLGG